MSLRSDYYRQTILYLSQNLCYCNLEEDTCGDNILIFKILKYILCWYALPINYSFHGIIFYYIRRQIHYKYSQLKQSCMFVKEIGLF